MATRDWSDEYVMLRRRHRAARGEPVTTANPNDLEAGPSSGSAIDQALQQAKAAAAVASAPWVVHVSEVQRDLEKGKTALRTLQRLHAERLRVQFEEDNVPKQEKEIEETVEQITTIIKQSEKRIRLIAQPEPGKRISQQERIIRANAMRSCGTSLQQLNKALRSAQKEFLQELRSQVPQQGHDGAFNSTSGIDLVDGAAEGTLNADEQAQLQEIEDQSQARYKEIINVAQSINELAQLFRELNVLIIEQGTILDRIDYNVEHAVEKVAHGTKVLKETEEKFATGLTTKCIGILIAVIVVLMLVLIVKKGS